jgi:peptidyl-prolyl cis-trans isomerase SurA
MRALTLSLMAITLLGGSSLRAQIAVPKYRGPVEAPAPQPPELPTPPATTPDGTVVEFPVARVNDQIIDNSDYLRAQQQLTDEAQQTGMSPADLEQHRKDLLRDLIDTQLLLSRGKELSINVDSETVRQLDEIRKRYHFDSMEALEKAVRDSGTSFEDFKAKINNQTITQQVVRDEVSRKLSQPTEKQEQAFYDQHKQEFTQAEQVRLSEILIPTPDDATDAQVAQANAKADDVEAKLKAGAKFEDLVKQFSGGPNADSGGDLGEFKRGQLGSSVLEDPTFVLQAGQWTAPIRTRQGFVILDVTEHTQAGVPPLSAVKDQIEQAMYEQEMLPALRAYLTDLREKAFIDIAQGYTDSAASSKQTKPVFAAASQPVVKKKVEQKARLDRARAAADAAKAQAKANGTKPVATMVAGKKQKKIKSEKIRYGQMPRNSLPETPEEIVAPGEGPGAPSSGQAAAEDSAAAAADQNQANMAADVDPFAPPAQEQKKTRFADRQAEMVKVHAQAKAIKAKEKIAMAAPTFTADEKLTQKTQNEALGLNGDTAAKKKKKKVKGAPKERIQEAAPAPPAPRPEATPIPPKSIRDNGEPVVAPRPANLPQPTPESSAPAASTPATATPQ